MKTLPKTLFALLALAIASGAEPAAAPPGGALNETEEILVGKWAGARAGFQWEIHRKADRTFEIAFREPDPDNPGKMFRNAARGVWWVDGKDYHFEWRKWWGDEGDFSGLSTEVVAAAKKDRVVTLSVGDEEPENIELRVKQFQMPEWKLLPGDKDAGGNP